MQQSIDGTQDIISDLTVFLRLNACLTSNFAFLPSFFRGIKVTKEETEHD